MTKDEALKLAQETLEANRQTHHYCEDTWYSCPKHEDGCANEFEGDECNCGADKANLEIDYAITAIKEALAQPEQEAFAWANLNALSEQINSVNCGTVYRLPSEVEGRQPLYTTPPQRKPLTDEEIMDLCRSLPTTQYTTAFARAIEAAHGIKGEA